MANGTEKAIGCRKWYVSLAEFAKKRWVKQISKSLTVSRSETQLLLRLGGGSLIVPLISLVRGSLEAYFLSADAQCNWHSVESCAAFFELIY